MTSKFDVPAFIGDAKNVQLVQPADKRRAFAFAKTEDGTVWVVGRTGFSILNTWRFNDVHRRAWCKLTGVPFADVKTAMKKLAEKEAKANDARNLARFKAEAKRRGFKLVKSRAPKT